MDLLVTTTERTGEKDDKVRQILCSGYRTSQELFLQKENLS